MKTVVAKVAGIAVVVLALAACSGEGDTPTPEPSMSVPDLVDESPTPAPTLGNEDDPLCAAAQENITVSQDVLTKSNELTELIQDPAFFTSDDATELNAIGADMIVLTENSLTFYEVGIAETGGDPVNADFVSMKGFITDYSGLMAQMAADAGTPAEFLMSFQEVATDPDLQDVLTAAPTAAGNIAAYVTERCGITG